ncbi:hypothetical protein POPTR_003G052150v4 [Populus trichocarpa]|jgi:Zn ribbon nucleic-acid-binding protein|uniref:Uncharacterized protein n=1 Tax=Populus trichocarpa TaxID=3694 RepID=A0ACC0T827_POPTR|nr:hypothetical protein BDE02_03G045700 [Populus trichocarpa]KAI9397553.1 hypothetical protein POPTR_003G052150v4 [Populus trichocarpa]
MGRYCGRFVSGSYCEECSCADCHNNVENEGVRREATECVNCKNLEGSELGMDVLWGNHGKTKACIQQAKAASSDAIVTSSHIFSQESKKIMKKISRTI